jgi:hypothetical protein
MVLTNPAGVRTEDAFHQGRAPSMRPDVVGRLQLHAGPDPAALVVRSDRAGRHLSPIACNVYCEGEGCTDGGAQETIDGRGYERPERAGASFEAVECSNRTEPNGHQDQPSIVEVFCPEPTSFFSVVSVRSRRLSRSAARAVGRGE